MPRTRKPVTESTDLPDKLSPRWEDLGLTWHASGVLDRAGIHSREDLAMRTREELLAAPGLTEATLRQCETLLGRPTPSALPYWLARGVPRPIAWRLSRHRVMLLADLRRLTLPELRQLGFSAYDAEALVALMNLGHFPKVGR